MEILEKSRHAEKTDYKTLKYWITPFQTFVSTLSLQELITIKFHSLKLRTVCCNHGSEWVSESSI